MGFGGRSARVASHAVAATIVAGVATYALLGIASQSLDDAAFDDFSVFWSLSLIIGFGVFLPVEQELARRGNGLVRADVGQAARTSALLVGGVLIVLAAAAAVGGGDGYPAVFIAAAAVAVVSPLQFVVRGILLATGRAATFSNVLIADAVLRVLLAAGAAVIVSATTEGGALWFAAVVPLSIATTHLLVLRRPLRSLDTRTGARDDRGRTHIFALLVPALAAQTLVNIAPILVFALGPVGAAGAFQATFSLARLPLFFAMPVQAMLIPPLMTLFANTHSTRLARGLVIAFASLAGAALVGAVVGFYLGPWAIELVFGPGRSLPPADVALLVAAVIVHVGMLLMTQVAVATSTHRSAVWSWIVALVVAAATFGAVIAFVSVETACGLGLLVGSVAGIALAGWLAHAHWRSA